MSNYFRRVIVLGGMCVALFLSGCSDERVTMITKEENPPNSAENGFTEETPKGEDILGSQTEVSTEEIGEEEKGITLEDICYANRGDVLLRDRSGYSATTVYYSSGTEIYEETEYIGFDDEGAYFQGYENSKGYAELLDIENECWYELEQGELTVLIYPEDGVADIMIDIDHNGVVYTLPADDEQEIISDVSKEDGQLVVTTLYTSDLAESYTRKFTLDDTYRILSIYTYDERGELYSYTRTTENSIFNVPDEIANVMYSTRKRTVSVVYSDGDGVGNEYQLPSAYELSIKLFSKNAYSDAQCQTLWQASAAVSGEYYLDEVIYLK